MEQQQSQQEQKPKGIPTYISDHINKVMAQLHHAETTLLTTPNIPVSELVKQVKRIDELGYTFNVLTQMVDAIRTRQGENKEEASRIIQPETPKIITP